MTQPLQIPDKLYFKIGEVSKIIGVEPYVLRYWESEFTQISPVKSRTNQRLYKRQDVELIANIRDLLYDQKFTIDGAKKCLKEKKKNHRKTTQEQQISLGLIEDKVDARKELDWKTLDTVISEMDQFLSKN